MKRKVGIIVYATICGMVLFLLVMFGSIIYVAEYVIPQTYTLDQIDTFGKMPLTRLARLFWVHQLQWFCTGLAFAYFIHEIQQLRRKKNHEK